MPAKRHESTPLLTCSACPRTVSSFTRGSGSCLEDHGTPGPCVLLLLPRLPPLCGDCSCIQMIPLWWPAANTVYATVTTLRSAPAPTLKRARVTQRTLLCAHRVSVHSPSPLAMSSAAAESSTPVTDHAVRSTARAAASTCSCVTAAMRSHHIILSTAVTFLGHCHGVPFSSLHLLSTHQDDAAG